jgi:hypothetical protein
MERTIKIAANIGFASFSGTKMKSINHKII